jgi:hypothetical protein
MHVTPQIRLLLAIGLVVGGVVVTYYASSGFSGAADFRVGATSIVPTGMLPVFVVGVIMFAYGLVHLLESIPH